MMQGNIPMGYKLVEGKIQLDELEVAIVKQIFFDYLSGASLATIAKRLAEMGIPNASNQPAWNHGFIGRILGNIKYLGDAFYPQMIDAEVFEQVRKRRQERCNQIGRGIQPNCGNRQYPFTGRLRCGECGESYRKYVEHRGRASEKPLWKCKKYIYKNRVYCRCGFLSDEQIKKAFLQAIKRLLARPQIFDRKPKKVLNRYNPEFHRLDQQIKELEAEGRYSSKELPVLLFKRAETFYKTARVDDAEYHTEKLKHALSDKPPLTEFDEALFDTVVRQITVHVDHRLVIEFINGLTAEVGY